MASICDRIALDAERRKWLEFADDEDSAVLRKDCLDRAEEVEDFVGYSVWHHYATAVRCEDA